jgi:hypothetical protein
MILASFNRPAFQVFSMAFKRLSFVAAASILALAACGTPVNKNVEFGGQYWQRVSVSESIYQQGPKAQQMLNRDIARCVTELRELERLGQVKNAIPTDMTGRVLDPDDKELEDWDTPERDQHLFAEQGDYHDFESCMLAKGWERVLHVPYDVADEARDNYIRAHKDYKYGSRIGESHTRRQTSNDVGDFGELNN